MSGEVTQKRSMRWRRALPPPHSAGEQFFRLRYRASGIVREHAAYAVLQLSGQDEHGERLSTTLLDCHGVINDGRLHTLIGKLTPAVAADQVLVQMATEDSETRLRIEALELYSDLATIPPAVASDSRVVRNEKGARFAPVPLEADQRPLSNDSVAAAFDRVLEKHKVVVDGGRGCPAGRFVVDDVPFLIASGTKNMVRPADQADPNEGKVDFLGEKVARRDFFRLSRDDSVAVPLGGRRTTEVFFLLVCEMPAIEWRYGLPSAPYRLDDVEAFAVELIYIDGAHDWALPYSLADGGCVLARMLGAYVVAADASRPLEKVVFHNRLFGVTMSVAAVTVNTADTRVVPSLVEETRPIEPPRLASPTVRRPYITYRHGLLAGGNRHYEFTIDCRDGFSIRSLHSRWSPKTPWSVSPSSGLEVAVDKTVFTGRAFVVDGVQVEGGVATIALRSPHALLPLAIALRLEVDQSPHLVTRLAATNRGNTPLAATIRFPVLKDLVIGEAQSTWMFFPQYRARLSRDRGFFVAPAGPYFSHQFFDAFNPAAGVGLMTLTDNRDQFPIEYSMAKSGGGVSCSIAYPARFHTIAPGQTFQTPRASLVLHAGDWHQAVAEYQDWLRSWYHPRRVRDDWWRKAFVMRSHVISPADSRKINCTPSIFDRASGQYRIDEAMAADRKYFDRPPDLVHFYGWYFRDQENSYGWGDYSTPEAYAQAGGLEALRRAIAHFQDDLDTPLSLYTIGDRCSLGTAACEQFGEKGSQWRDGGPLAVEDTSMGKCRTMCWGYRPWQDYHIADLTNLRRDTGAKIVYLDVFPLQTGQACDSVNHGHETPLWFDRTSHQVLRRVRDALSQDAAIYSEYPMSDVTSQDIDGNVAYYHLPLYRHFDKLYDVPSLDERAAVEAETPFQLYRYVFPAIKQFCFGVGVEHSRSDSCLKIPFFNGDAELAMTWRLKPERIRLITNRGLAIQKQYVDCFATDSPQPMVTTERRGVYANRFPGQHRNLWTLWNARYQTVRGPVLAVDHRPGDRYFDAWNDRPLQPQAHADKVMLSLELEPQGLGCIVQERDEKAR